MHGWQDGSWTSKLIKGLVEDYLKDPFLNKLRPLENVCSFFCHIMQTDHQQRQFSISLWAGILCDFHIGPHVLLARVTLISFKIG
jgi:hypothetical protein